MYEIEVQEASAMSSKGKACFGKFITFFLNFAGPPRKKRGNNPIKKGSLVEIFCLDILLLLHIYFEKNVEIFQENIISCIYFLFMGEIY